MTNVNLVPAPERPLYTDADGRPIEKLSASGSICLLCRTCQDHGLDHLCLANIVSAGVSLGAWGRHAEIPSSVMSELREQLTAHPAQPYNPDTDQLRPIDWTWCSCSGCASKRTTTLLELP